MRVALRDRAIFAVMLFGFVRVGAVVKMLVRDFEDGDNAWLVLHEKGGRERRIPCHHKTRDYLRSYMQAAGLEPGSRVPMFQSAPRRSRALTGLMLDRGAVLRIVKRRCKAVGLPASVCNHSFRATGITIHQENGGDIVEAQKLAGHADLRTTQLYNRKTRQDAARRGRARAALGLGALSDAVPPTRSATSVTDGCSPRRCGTARPHSATAASPRYDRAMSDAIKRAVASLVAAWSERDPARRAHLLFVGGSTITRVRGWLRPW